MRHRALLLGLGLLLRPLAAGACGGGTVSVDESIGANVQRIVLSVHGTVTDVVTQIAVPESSAGYGVIIPAPAQPTLDPLPVAESELAALDEAMAPIVYLSEDDSGAGCTCIPTSGGDDRGAQLPLELSEPVNIGPVTAVVLTAETGTAVQGWLTENGFTLPDASRPIVDAYSGSGKYFIAIRRNDAAVQGPSSIGIHFTLPGDQRALPLRFASIGAAPSVTFVLFVAGPVVVGPSAPFAALTLGDLDATLLRQQQYAAAIERAVGEHDGRAFVLERASSPRSLYAPLSQRLRSWFAEDALITRLSTILTPAAMTEDVTFNVPFTGTLYPATVRLETSPDLRPAGTGALCAVALAAALRRRTRRTRANPVR